MVKTEQEWADEVNCLKAENCELKSILQREQTKNKSEELKTAALPLLKFLNKYYHPHAYAIVTEGRVEVVEGNMAAPLPVRD